MKKLWPWILATTTLAAGWAAGQTAARRSVYTDANYGFTLAAPNLGMAKGIGVVPVTMLGPAENGFAANVNVMIEDRNTTRKEFRDENEADLKQREAKINSFTDLTVSGQDAVQMDFEAELAGKPMHFLNQAVITPGRVYLITCTDTADGFKKHEAEFRASLASFKLSTK